MKHFRKELWFDIKKRRELINITTDVKACLIESGVKEGCIIAHPYDTEKGAGTMSPHTFLRALGPQPWSVAYVEPSRRPTDGRYAENPNRLQLRQQRVILVKANHD